ncbi:MAG: PQQ-dependent sugar dehydrogenase, partial [Gloeobacteraceae cyanobacterium ES-bin-144]|nr:PQQ-dependent sugar dehydrogenase [Verrucomicrobiales bacterium]
MIVLRIFLISAFSAVLSAFAVANNAPLTPTITEPKVDGHIVNPADAHMETAPFSDVDSGADGQFRSTDFEIWTITPAQRIWSSLNVSGVESFHTHLGDGVFENSHAGRTELFAETNYRLRIRHRDNSNIAASEYSPWSERLFTTGSLSAIFPIILTDILVSPAPEWKNTANQTYVLPVSPTAHRVRIVAEDDDFSLLEFLGNDGLTNLVTNFPSGSHDHAFKIQIEAGSTPLAMPRTTLRFSDNLGISYLVYLPAISLAANQTQFLWVSLNGSTYFGTTGQTTPDFTSLARGSAVPWISRQPGYTVEVVASGLRMPVNVVFVPNPAPDADAPICYITELYGTIKVMLRNGTVSNYATNLINYSPSGAFPGSGEQGLGGLAIHPTTGDVYVAALYENSGTGNNPRIVKLTSSDGGRTSNGRSVILNMAPEVQGQSHFCANLTFGPDGKLYLHNGDGFDAATALDLNQFRGKVLRFNSDGSAPSDNPFYNVGNGITATDYIFAYGLRNPFGGAWRATDGQHYSVENGPDCDRFAKITSGTSYGWSGNSAEMSINALYVWENAVGPVNLTFIQPETFGGSAFPPTKMGRAYVTLSGATYASGPQSATKCIQEFQLDHSGAIVGTPQTLIEYNGSGKATACGLAAGPDGLYFTDLYKDLDTTGPTDTGANLLRVRYTGFANFSANNTSGVLPLAVQFQNTSDVPNSTSYFWDFGDGSTSTQQNPLHTYTTAGAYSVLLSVTGSGGIVQSRRDNFIAAGVTPPSPTHRYYRFTPTQVRNATTADSVQLAEFHFRFAGDSIVGGGLPIVTNPGGNNPVGEGAPNLVDSNTSTKWLDKNKLPAVFDFVTPVEIDSYAFTTANDNPDRDPVSWTLEASDDGDSWLLLDTQTNYATTTDRFTATPPIVIPSLRPRIVSFNSSPVTIFPGGSSTISWTTQGADSVTLTPSYGSVSTNGSVVTTLAASQTYTLTATNSNGSVSANLTVNVSTNTDVTYQWFRFTPTKLRNNATSDSVQLAEFNLYLGSNEVIGATATNPNRVGVPNEGPQYAVDQNVNTKWNDLNKGRLILQYPAPVTVDRYSFVTANDYPNRDPVSWTIEGSADGVAWTLLHTVTDNATTLNRFTDTGPFLIHQNNMSVLFVVAEASNPNTSEQAIAARILTLGFSVEFITDSLSTTADATGKRLILIASSVTAAQVNTKFRDVAVPLINWDHALYDDLAMIAPTVNQSGTFSGLTDLNITQPNHPLAAGYSGQNIVFSIPSVMSWGNPGANASRIASVVGDSNKAVIFSYEAGVGMYDRPAPARRVGFFFEDISGEHTLAKGWDLFDR